MSKSMTWLVVGLVAVYLFVFRKKSVLATTATNANDPATQVAAVSQRVTGISQSVAGTVSQVTSSVRSIAQSLADVSDIFSSGTSGSTLATNWSDAGTSNSNSVPATGVELAYGSDDSGFGDLA